MSLVQHSEDLCIDSLLKGDKNNFRYIIDYAQYDDAEDYSLIFPVSELDYYKEYIEKLADSYSSGNIYTAAVRQLNKHPNIDVIGFGVEFHEYPHVPIEDNWFVFDLCNVYKHINKTPMFKSGNHKRFFNTMSWRGFVNFIKKNSTYDELSGNIERFANGESFYS